MKIWAPLTVLVGGPIIGAVVGLTGAGLQFPADPTGRGAPGDGFGLFLGVLIGWASLASFLWYQLPG